VSEFIGASITTADQITETIGIPVLETIPIIQTYKDRAILKRRIVWAAASGVGMCLLASAVLLYHLRT
jgi:hypothetical protein